MVRLRCAKFMSRLLVLFIYLRINDVFATTDCQFGAFKCANNKCIMDIFTCDNNDDCGDYSDEKNCSCPGAFQCDNGKCVSLKWLCDTEDDCGDNSDERNCTGIDPCFNNGDCDHACQVTRATNGTAIGKKCKCRLGYYLRQDGKTCEDIDECTNLVTCDGKCFNTIGSYYCDCSPQGLKMAPDNKTCLDIDECAHNNGGCEHICQNTYGSYKCKCKTGYSISFHNPKHCVDIDDCAWGIPNCHVCINTHGGYMCDCNIGYTQNANKTSCSDIDECAGDKNGGCEHICFNSPGTYECRCKSGFKELTPDSKACIDKDECQENEGKGPCQHKCTNSLGSYNCYCDPGFKMGIDGKSCVDIDECQNPATTCSDKCVNYPGSYKCECEPNFFLASDGKTCRDSIDYSVCGNSSGTIKQTTDWEETEPIKWPWVVHFKARYGWAVMTVEGCLGTILSRYWVITVERCLTSSTMYVVTNNEMPIRVKDVKQTNKGSVRLVLLETPITFVETVRPICLPKISDLKTTVRGRAKTLGMILHKEGDEGIYKKSVRIAHSQECTLGDLGQLFNKTMFCAGNKFKARLESCPGDSGSPLMYSVKSSSNRNKIYLGGILLSGRDVLSPDGRCKSTHNYLAFYNLEKYISWIRRVTGLKPQGY